MNAEGLLTSAAWRKSSFSGTGGNGGGNCVGTAWLADDTFAVRDSKNPDAMLIIRAELAGWIEGIKAGVSRAR